ncbi:unnamed protein product [Protopolystoma xenopodis]|uniref:Uncharacterized protein n=1 Tax=Protopolystoma xenopodis TaxID=117903 RepID=A0A3S5AXJ0_9PLAT|nr:unnamed protein product [Protopolystoma xenopodis]
MAHDFGLVIDALQLTPSILQAYRHIENLYFGSQLESAPLPPALFLLPNAPDCALASSFHSDSPGLVSSVGTSDHISLAVSSAVTSNQRSSKSCLDTNLSAVCSQSAGRALTGLGLWIATQRESRPSENSMATFATSCQQNLIQPTQSQQQQQYHRPQSQSNQHPQQQSQQQQSQLHQFNHLTYLQQLNPQQQQQHNQLPVTLKFRELHVLPFQCYEGLRRVSESL